MKKEIAIEKSEEHIFKYSIEKGTESFKRVERFREMGPLPQEAIPDATKAILDANRWIDWYFADEERAKVHFYRLHKNEKGKISVRQGRKSGVGDWDEFPSKT